MLRLISQKGYFVKSLFVDFGQLAAGGEAEKASEIAEVAFM